MGWFRRKSSKSNNNKQLNALTIEGGNEGTVRDTEDTEKEVEAEPEEESTGGGERGTTVEGTTEMPVSGREDTCERTHEEEETTTLSKGTSISGGEDIISSPSGSESSRELNESLRQMRNLSHMYDVTSEMEDDIREHQLRVYTERDWYLRKLREIEGAAHAVVGKGTDKEAKLAARILDCVYTCDQSFQLMASK